MGRRVAVELVYCMPLFGSRVRMMLDWMLVAL